MKLHRVITLLIVGVIGLSSFAGAHGRLIGLDNERKALSERVLSTHNENYDMVIIAPELFSDALQPLIDHKNNVGIATFLKTTEAIYDEFGGRDQAEQIKYFTKDAIENYGIKYVMLVGDVHLLPMRKCSCTVKTGVINWYYILSDLYYADIYDSGVNFSSWDSNENDKFGEFTFENRGGFSIIDDVDLYPDVGVGRIPCGNIGEVNIVVDKIINYEIGTSSSDWFNRVILMGGDTTPNFANAYEGEWLLTRFIGPAMEKHGFNLVKLFTSSDTFHPDMINQEITLGSGFVCYAGHGYPDKIATYPPQGDSAISYSIEDMNGLNNGYKLPIFFFDACLTGKLDYDIFDKVMIPLSVNLPIAPINFLKRVFDTIDANKILPYFVWSLITKESGGGIAAIGASQPGILGIEYHNGEILDIGFGSSCLHKYFFESYEPRMLLSDMFIQAQNAYINLITGPGSAYDDRITINEFNLFGDPSLKIGGYS